MNNAGMLEKIDFTQRPVHEKEVNAILAAKSIGQVLTRFKRMLTNENSSELYMATGERLIQLKEHRLGRKYIAFGKEIEKNKKQDQREKARAERLIQDLKNLLK